MNKLGNQLTAGEQIFNRDGPNFVLILFGGRNNKSVISDQDNGLFFSFALK